MTIPSNDIKENLYVRSQEVPTTYIGADIKYKVIKQSKLQADMLEVLPIWVARTVYR